MKMSLDDRGIPFFPYIFSAKQKGANLLFEKKRRLASGDFVLFPPQGNNFFSGSHEFDVDLNPEDSPYVLVPASPLAAGAAPKGSAFVITLSSEHEVKVAIATTTT
eukprot:GEZU01020499.1.p1 GENE.GEZU01020499.1~~GEZU01020499.1.p1  ORF type:complete len:106 (+),score=44.55 GEZU01020499.1:163-480(+)